MKNLKKLLLVLFVIASVECRAAKRIPSPDITIIPTGVVPKICVTARRELPPCGIGKFKKTQREYEDKIEKMRQSYVDMVIDFKDTKDVSFENYGPGRIYLESFESLDRQMQEEKERKKADRERIKVANANSSKSRVPKIENPEVSVIRVIRSLEQTVITASECIPLGVEFCDDFPRPDENQDEKNSRIQKRSLPSIQDYMTHLWNHELKKKSELESNKVTDGLIEIIPQNGEEFFSRVTKRSIPDDLNRLDNEKVFRGLKFLMKNVNESPRLRFPMFSGRLSKRMEFHDFMAELRKLFEARRYEEEEQSAN